MKKDRKEKGDMFYRRKMLAECDYGHHTFGNSVPENYTIKH